MRELRTRTIRVKISTHQPTQGAVSVVSRLRNLLRRDLAGTRNPRSEVARLRRRPMLIVYWAGYTFVTYLFMLLLKRWFGFPAAYLSLAVFISYAFLPHSSRSGDGPDQT